MLNPYIEINHEALSYNLNSIKSVISSTNISSETNNPKIMAVVKSNAYGHGLIGICKSLENQVDMFGVGFLSEAVMLRENSIDGHILVLGPCYDFETVQMNNVEITIENFEQVEQLNNYCRQHKEARFKVHIKVDSGMRRFGFAEEEVLDVFMKLNTNIDVTGVFSHMITSPILNEKKCLLQFNNFTRVKKKVEAYLVENGKSSEEIAQVCFHLSNSENAIDLPQTRFSMIRLGNSLFGPIGTRNKVELKRVAKIKFPLVSIHEHKKGEWIGYNHKYKLKSDTTLGVCMGGFYEGHGLVKSPSGAKRYKKMIYYIKALAKAMLRKEFVLCNGHKYEVLGSVFMQYIQIDITNNPLNIGDYIEVTKSPLYFDSSLERKHILEEKNATH